METIVSPVTGTAIGLLALWMKQQRNFLLAAALVGISDASLRVIAGVSPVGLTAASVVGASGSLLQAWMMWPFALLAKHIGRSVRERTER